ncbi:MAG: GNAT family protein [Chitinophagaceae bacterium]|nr:GNAT family N-acetyltransferase [Chitinophagaceae bacterium]MCB0740329.1 GNAT family N-acetyltransferase [Chitinophagaceae bacterium]
MEFTLRPWAKTDIDALVEYGNNYNIARNMRNIFPHPYTNQDAVKFLERTIPLRPVNIFAIDINGKASGGIGVFPQDDIMCKNAELGYWLAEPFWGKGIITKAIGQVVAYGFKTFDIDRIYAIPFGTNIASQKALEKAGFRLEARFDKTIFKNGVYYDELVYAIRK